MGTDAPTSTTSGLTAADAAARLRRDGPNRLPEHAPPRAVVVLARQFVHFFALLLWAAGGLAIAAGMPQLGIAIFLVVVLNGAFAFAQEHRAERAAASLRGLLPVRARVIRDGVAIVLDAESVVVGDRIVLEAGDRLPADLRVERADAASVDTSTLTGESVPTSLDRGDPAFAGTFLVEGEAMGEVIATGPRTRLASIAQLARSNPRPRSPLSRELDRVVRTIATIAVLVGGAFFLFATLIGIGARDGFLFAIGVTVALVPEGLLPTVTLSLAIGAQRMAERNALVRRLESVETLGSTTYICTDKTGTLTRNEMTVVRVWTPSGEVGIEGAGYGPTASVRADDPAALEAAGRAALTARRSSTGRAVRSNGTWCAHGDPMDAAIDALASRLGVDTADDEGRRPERAVFPFDPRRRRRSVVTGDRLLVKGAPDGVFDRCREVGDARAAHDAMTGSGLRVVAVASRKVAVVPDTADEAERDLQLEALFGLLDPPRTEAADAIAACRRAGIRVAMVTGDDPATAAAIARRVGLRPEGGRVLTGDELPQDGQVLGALLDRDGVVIGRVTPEDKLRIAVALRARGHVVAMTGDGVNDGPALHASDIGIAMGLGGTDVAREAADLVLLDDDFATIAAAVEQGRATYSNIQRFLTYHLTDNVAELTPFVLWALAAGRFPLALGVLQVLALDLGTDTGPAVALGAEPAGPHALLGPPRRGHLLDRTVIRRAFGILGPVEAVFEIAAFTVTLWLAGWRPGADAVDPGALAAASGAAFSAVVLGQAANAFACRSSVRPPWRLPTAANRLLVGAVAIELAFLAILLVMEPIADLLDQALPTVEGAVIAALTAPALLVADAAWKARRRGRIPTTRDGPGARRS